MSSSSGRPLISVLLPAWNAERYLGEAVESVLTQTLSDFELIVIDDGSTDETPDIIRKYAKSDRRIRVLTQPNGGIGTALNAGLSLARAPYVARMDSDDVCLPHRFEKQIAFLEANPDVVLVGSRVLLIDPDGAPLFEMDSVQLSHEKIDELLLQARWSIVHPSVMIRIEAFRKTGGYNNDLVPVEDHDLFLRLAEIGRLANIPDILLKYRKHPMNSVRVLGDRRVSALTRVMESAWERRGITDRSAFPVILPDVDRDDPHRELKEKRNWSWQCLRIGNVNVARKYAFAGLRAAPLASESWKLLYCALRGH